MAGLWQETTPEQNAGGLSAAKDMPGTGWKQVRVSGDEDGRLSALVQARPQLVVAVNGEPVVHAVPVRIAHGEDVVALAFGTVDDDVEHPSAATLANPLWGWICEALSADEHEGIGVFRKLLTAEKIASLAARCDRGRGDFLLPVATYRQCPAAILGGYDAGLRWPWLIDGKELK